MVILIPQQQQPVLTRIRTILQLNQHQRPIIMRVTQLSPPTSAILATPAILALLNHISLSQRVKRLLLKREKRVKRPLLKQSVIRILLHPLLVHPHHPFTCLLRQKLTAWMTLTMAYRHRQLMVKQSL